MYSNGRITHNLADRWLWVDWRNVFCNKSNTLAMRRIRAAIKKLDDPKTLGKYRFFDGYDGPKPYPQSMWPRIMEHAMKFGGIYRSIPNSKDYYWD